MKRDNICGDFLQEVRTGKSAQNEEMGKYFIVEISNFWLFCCPFDLFIEGTINDIFLIFWRCIQPAGYFPEEKA